VRKEPFPQEKPLLFNPVTKSVNTRELWTCSEHSTRPGTHGEAGWATYLGIQEGGI